MASPAALNPNDPIVQALQAEVVAKQAYDNAGYHRNFLEAKVKQAEADLKGNPSADQRKKAEQARNQAATDLPEAQRKVEEAQEQLKRAQTLLAQLTGTPNPHAKQKAPRSIPKLPKVPQLPSSGEEASPPKAVASAERGYREEVRVMRSLVPPAAYLEHRVYFSLTRFIDRKDLQQEMEKILKDLPQKIDKKKYIPQNGEMIQRRFEYLKVHRGESAMLMEHFSKLPKGVQTYLRADK